MHDPADTVPAPPPSWPLRAWQWCVRWRFALGLAAVAVVFALSSIPNARPPRVRGLDKVQHVVEYLLLALVFLNVGTRGFVRVRFAPVAAAWAAALVVAVLDEIYQRWVPGRRFDLWDVLSSATGVTLAAVATLVLYRLWNGRARTRS